MNPDVVTAPNALSGSSDGGTSRTIIWDQELFAVLHLPRRTARSVIAIKIEVAGVGIGFDDLINVSEVRKIVVN